MKRKYWDVASYQYNSLLVLDYFFIYNLYDLLFVLDYLFFLEPDCLIIRSRAWLFIFSAGWK